jgi:sphinganine-1-phosphate aldolase
VITQAFRRYVLSNPLHPEVFPAIRKMEAEVVSMCLRMYNSVDGAGAMTSGGTESIIMAVKTYRDWARDTKGITEPEMYVNYPPRCCTPVMLWWVLTAHDSLCLRIVPSSAHAAFWKAAAYLNVKLHSVPIDLISRKADLKRMKRAMYVFHC